MKTVTIIGMGMTPQDLTDEHLQIIKKAEILIGGKRLLGYFEHCSAQKKIIDKNITDLIEFIKDRAVSQSIVVLASGDPLFFGIGARLVTALGGENIVIYPNISSVAAAFARIKEPWGNARVVSLHGRNNESVLFSALEKENVVAVLTDRKNSPARLSQLLIEKEFVNFKICVLESLGTTEERFNWYRLDRAAEMEFAEPNLVVLKRSSKDPIRIKALHLGMPESYYHHQQGLITKSEIRAITLSKLRLLKDHVLWDLGAGSGSISIEASLLVPLGKVIAIEKKPERVQQIEINKSRFGTQNLEIVQAVLPEGLEGLSRPDRIFIGGGGRDLEDIINAAAAYLKSNGLIVVNTVLMQNLQTAVEALKTLDFKTSEIQVQVSRSREMPWGDRFEAQNPVWIITGMRKAECGSGKE
ncbi:MAG: precorrin-6y C5,15-methyltransferase (decarboxylating) subunit CbiE [Desulfobacterales bacterium]|jgi:precorrin-6Y C5,15-methyltransferase (decarboxylating)